MNVHISNWAFPSTETPSEITALGGNDKPLHTSCVAAGECWLVHCIKCESGDDHRFEAVERRRKRGKRVLLWPPHILKNLKTRRQRTGQRGNEKQVRERQDCPVLGASLWKSDENKSWSYHDCFIKVLCPAFASLACPTASSCLNPLGKNMIWEVYNFPGSWEQHYHTSAHLHIRWCEICARMQARTHLKVFSERTIINLCVDIIQTHFIQGQRHYWSFLHNKVGL